MALNNAFTTGQILTSTEMNNMPFGVAAFDSDASNFNLTTTLTAVTGLSVTWTADSTRLYKITWFEPACQTSTAVSYINLQLRQTSSGGTQLQSILAINEVAASLTTAQTCIFIGSFASTSITVVPCALTSITTGTPRLAHSATARAFLIVEDVGLA